MVDLGMFITGLHVTGARGAEEFEARALGRVVDLPGGPPGVAVADALVLFYAALDRHRTARAMVDLGLADDEAAVIVLVEDGFPTQVTLPTATGVRALLPGDGSRSLRISVEVELDPPLFGRLRGLAVRDPRLVTALGSGARITVKVGWLFTNDLLVASASVLGVAVGDTGFPIVGSERPSWLTDLLMDMGTRFRRVGTDSPERTAKRLLNAMLSPDTDRRRRYWSAAEAFERPPFSLGELELVVDGDRVDPCFGPGLLRPRQFGPAAAEALRLVEAVVVEAPDVLIVDAPGHAQRDPAQVRGWLEAFASSDRATVEQVVLVPCGARDPEQVA
jgi:hypothetical protein